MARSRNRLLNRKQNKKDEGPGESERSGLSREHIEMIEDFFAKESPGRTQAVSDGRRTPHLNLGNRLSRVAPTIVKIR
jgi:hypothetical protein